MPSLLKKSLLFLVPAAAALAANTQISTDKPVINFRLPSFSADGFRTYLVRGSEARYANENQIGIKELVLTIFSGKADEKIDTLILSPDAIVHPNDTVVTGPTTIRVINDQFEASGSDWRYAHKDKKVSIAKNVRVTFKAEFKDILK